MKFIIPLDSMYLMRRQVFGRRLLSSLTDAFGVMVFEEGFFHADPHPGNIFIRLGGLVEYVGYVKVMEFGA